MAPPSELSVEHGVSLAPFCSLGVGGAARWWARATRVDDVAAAHAWCADRGAALVVLGGGTNVVVADEGVDGLVLAVAPRGVTIADQREAVTVTAAAGEPWDEVVAAVVARGGAGLECLSGIPGLAGGTPIQNVGAYGQEVSSAIERLTVFDRTTASTVSLGPGECGFAYRTSRFKGEDAGRFIICDVTFRAAKRPASTSYRDVDAALTRAGIVDPTVAQVRTAVLEIRRGKGMVRDEHDPDSRSVGSFFTNPVVTAAAAERMSSDAGTAAPWFAQPDGRVKVPAAWLIEKAGFVRGEADGAVGLSTKHTLALVTRAGAAAADVVRFAARIARRVEDRFGVRLRPEPVFLGFPRGDDVDYLLGAHD